jgi:hypothetical protein
LTFGWVDGVPAAVGFNLVPNFLGEGDRPENTIKLESPFDAFFTMSPIKQQLLDAIEQAPEAVIEQILRDILTPKHPLETLIQSGRIIAPSGSRSPIDETAFQTFTQTLTGTTLSDLITDDRQQW